MDIWGHEVSLYDTANEHSYGLFVMNITVFYRAISS